VVQPGTPVDETILDSETVMTLEAYADTILPGEKRFPGDRAVAGVASGGGAVASGAVDVLRTQEGGLGPLLGSLAAGVNQHAEEYAQTLRLGLDDGVPAFVALPFAHRTALIQRLTAAECEDRELWVSLAMFSTIAFDAAAHLSTTEALAAGHPGLTWMGFAAPEADGLWRFPAYSYGRPLAAPHPDTTPSGSPA
jgi:hypothetical protein